MSILDRILGRDTKTVATMIPTWQDGKATYPEVSFEAMVRGGWRKNELIYSCISKKAGTAAQVKLKFYPNGGKKELGKKHPLSQLIRFPNPFMSEYDLWSQVIILCDLAGRAAFEKERNLNGDVIRLWPLRPDWLHPIPDENKFLVKYSYEVPGQPAAEILASEVVEFKVFDPLNAYDSYPPVAVAARVGSVDNTATDFLKLFFERGGSPPGYIKTVQKLREQDVTDIRRRWKERYGGITGWLEPAVLDKDADYVRTGLTFNEMGFEVLDARNESRICSILKVPPILVSAKVGLDRSTFSNYKEARNAWWEDDLLPIYRNYQDVIQQQLIEPDFTQGAIEARWDFSEVPALREERIIIWQRANEGLKMGGITVNEYRAEIGLASVAPEVGDVFLRPMNLAEVALDGSTPTELEVEEETEEEETEEEETEEEETEGEGKSFKAGAPKPPDWRKRKKLESKIDATIQQFLAGQKRRVLKELERLEK